MIDASPFLKTLEGKPVAVFGLGVSGLATVRALVKARAQVYVADDDPEKLSAAIEVGGVEKTFDVELLKTCGCLVLAPGVPLHFPEPHNVVKAAREADIEIIGDIEILHHCAHGRKVIGVTGTNGKSTVTALIDHILNENGIEALAVGNIGQPVLDIDLPGENGVLVMELSSFQIDLCPTFRPDIGVVLKITPDHIDRHGSFEAYKAAKMRLLDGAGVSIIEEDNFKATARVAEEFDLSQAQIESAIKTFEGLPHRQQFIRRIGNVSYINDSKATNAEATIYALQNFEDVYLIIGGLAKEGGLDGIEKFRDKIRHVFVIGEETHQFSTWLEQQKMIFTECGILAEATSQAHDMAQEAGVGTVLLSPACASYDQFSNFEERGEQFMLLVQELGDTIAA